MKSRSTIITISIILLMLIVGAAYWYFFFNGAGGIDTSNNSGSNANNGGFAPFGREPAGTSTNPTNNVPTITAPEPSIAPIQGKIPTLRLLSNTPVGGYGASTTATTTVVRWIDRGRGNIFEVKENQPETTTLSNTILPRIYESTWNKNLTAFIGSMLAEKSSTPTVLYSELQKQTLSTTTTPYVLKGKNVTDSMIGYAVSPAGNQVFMMINENGQGVGYISDFNGGKMTKIFDTPLTQVNVEWPEANTIALTTKGLSTQAGFLYFVNPKTGVWKKILGPIFGLSTKTSHDAKYVLISSAGSNFNVNTTIYSLTKGSYADATVRTLADKCAWGNFYKNMIYCGVPAQAVSGAYPDDWYRGTMSFADKIWQIDAATGEIHTISSIVDQSDRVIDAFNMGTDAKDGYLIFMNKNDLSLWSLDLVASH